MRWSGSSSTPPCGWMWRWWLSVGVRCSGGGRAPSRESWRAMSLGRVGGMVFKVMIAAAAGSGGDRGSGCGGIRETGRGGAASSTAPLFTLPRVLGGTAEATTRDAQAGRWVGNARGCCLSPLGRPRHRAAHLDRLARRARHVDRHVERPDTGLCGRSRWYAMACHGGTGAVASLSLTLAASAALDTQQGLERRRTGSAIPRAACSDSITVRNGPPTALAASTASRPPQGQPACKPGGCFRRRVKGASRESTRRKMSASTAATTWTLARGPEPTPADTQSPVPSNDGDPEAGAGYAKLDTPPQPPSSLSDSAARATVGRGGCPSRARAGCVGDLVSNTLGPRHASRNLRAICAVPVPHLGSHVGVIVPATCQLLVNGGARSSAHS